MASLKAEKPVGTQAPGQVKKEPAKPTESTPKAVASKPAPKKAEQKPREPKKKVYIYIYIYIYIYTHISYINYNHSLNCTRA
jgi:hypothetical protein